MKRTALPQIRVISVEHDRTTLAAQRLRHRMDAHGLHKLPVLSVFCHLEAGRCGVPAGVVGLEVDGAVVWVGKELTDHLAEQFCDGLASYMAPAKAAQG